jgi:hypothetical protein
VISASGVPEAYKILYPFSPDITEPVQFSKAGYIENNGKIGYSIQGLVAKVKDTVANG